MRCKMILGVVAVVTVLSMVSLSVFAGPDGNRGNGAPQAKLIGTLNIIGVSNPKSVNMDSASGSTIFLPLSGTTAIYLTEGPDFAVLDKNATDGRGEFQLPNPGLDPYVVGNPGDADTEADYSVFVRPLGKPGGSATITTCAELVDSTFAGLLPGTFLRTLNKACIMNPDAYASVQQVGADILTRKKGKSSFTNVTAELLTIVFKVEVMLADGTIEVVYVRVPIFSDIIQGEYWEYDNNHLKLCQVRFFDCPTDVVLSDGNWNNE